LEKSNGHQRLKGPIQSERQFAIFERNELAPSEPNASAATQIKCLRLAHNHWALATTQHPKGGKRMTSKRRKLPNRRSCFLFRIEGCRHVKNQNTARQELERLAGESAVGQGIDPLHVLGAITAYFYGIAEAMRKTPDATLSQIASFYEKAGKYAALAAPYRHGRLSAIKLIGDPNAATGGFKPDAMLDELRVELGKQVLAMAHSGLIDIDPTALPQPENRATAAQSVGAK
jgi:hypothetical protein